MSGEKQLKSVCVCENCDPDNEKVKGQKNTQTNSAHSP